MTGLRTLRNAFVRRNGGAQNRPGSSVVSNLTSNYGAKTRLIPFIYNQTAAYCVGIVLGPPSGGAPVLKFWINGAPYKPTGATAYNGGTAYKMGDLVTYSGNTYVCTYGSFTSDPRLKGGTLSTITGVTPTDDYTNWHLLPSGEYEIPFPSLMAADMFNVRYDQTGNNMIFAYTGCSQMRLTRWVDANGKDAFGVFNAVCGTYMGNANPGNNQADSNTIAVSSANSVYAIVAVSAAGDERAQQVNSDGTNAATIPPNGDLTTTNTNASAGTPITITWFAVNNAVLYKVYKMNKATGAFGYLGSTVIRSFVDNGITPDYTNPWVQASYYMTNVYSVDDASGGCPGAVGFHQQRTFYGNTNKAPSSLFGSETGLYDNFNIHTPTLATDAMTFKMSGQQDVVQHILSLGTLIVFTYGSVNSINGDSAGAISPSAINPHRESVHGASSLRPLIVGEFALYCQSQGAIIRDLGFNFQVGGYRGDDLTVFATHLFDNYTIVDWSYQPTPHSVVWAVRNDGTLLSLTYVREQQVMAWAHHDTQGYYESVCCVPEGNKVAVYTVVNRNYPYDPLVGGAARFIERFYPQQYSDTIANGSSNIPGLNYNANVGDIRDYIGMDCATTFDGRNRTLSSANRLTISGGTNYNETELLTATLSGTSFLSFTSGMATNGDMLFLYDSSGTLYRFKITSYTSATVVQGFLDRSLPVSMQNTPLWTWSRATKVLTGLSYLNGKNVAVLGDGNVVGSPNNPSYPVYTVSGGTLTLDQPYSVIQVGLPFITDIETLDIDTPGQLENLADKFKIVGEVTLYMVSSRPVWVGGRNPDKDLANTAASPVYRLTEQKVRHFDNYDSPIGLMTGKITQTIQPEWDQNGRVFIRNVDPTPMTIAAISPDGLFPIRGAM